MEEIMTESTIVAIGWLGFFFCTLAYLLLNLKVLRFNQPVYQILNVLGGLGLVISALYFNDTPNLASNLVWVLIALFGVIRYSKERYKSTRSDGVADTQ